MVVHGMRPGAHPQGLNWTRGSPTRSVGLKRRSGVRPTASGSARFRLTPTVLPSRSLTDGKLWFLTGEGVQVVDPRRLVLNKLPPPVHIERIAADDKPYDLRPGMRLPANVRNLRIDYTALSLVAPEKIHFKYKLEGQNRNWHEVINERQASYTNLPPRNYRFRVIASNNSGVWNETGDMLEFSIAPAYYQTSWFGALCVAAFLAMHLGTVPASPVPDRAGVRGANGGADAHRPRVA